MKLGLLAKKIGGRLIGDDGEILGLRSLQHATTSDLSAILHPKDLRWARRSKALGVITNIDVAASHAHELSCSIIAVENADLAFAKAIELLLSCNRRYTYKGVRGFVDPEAKLGRDVCISPMAYVGEARIGDRTLVLPHTFIDHEVTIGSDCFIGPGCVIFSGCTLSDKVRLTANVVVGNDGFVFAPNENRNERVRSTKGVQIGQEVELGAGVCIDAGVLEQTRVGSRSKLDNMVQIGHDVEIGSDTLICGQAGIGGFTKIGKESLVGGQAGVSDHLVVGEGVRIGGKSGVFRNLESREICGGNPAVPHLIHLRASSLQTRLYQLYSDVRSLKRLVMKLSNRLLRTENGSARADQVSDGLSDYHEDSTS